MHTFDPDVDAFAAEVFRFARARAAKDATSLPLGASRSAAELDAACGPTITEAGLGPNAVLQLFEDVLEPACLSVDFPRYFAFVPAAPTETAILADLVVSACSIYGGSWQEGAGAIWAENQALRWLADLAALPADAGGCFVSGGTAGNLSALVAARDATRRDRDGRVPDGGWAVVTGASSHSSVRAAAAVMDVEVHAVEGERLTGDALERALAAIGDRAFAVVATAGTTNLGIVDDLVGVADVCSRRGVWMHVDAAYGGAALAAPSVRDRFNGVERSDSLIVDPHKWLFAPFDVCALLYREPARARLAHMQQAAYLDVLTAGRDWNPSEYAIHLSRRARGLPFWFSLAAHGTAAYRSAIETCLAITRDAAEQVRARPNLQLVCEPELSIVAFTRAGWTRADYESWSLQMLERGEAFVVPSAHDGEPMLRLCIVNPRTTGDDVRLVLDSLA